MARFFSNGDGSGVERGGDGGGNRKVRDRNGRYGQTETGRATTVGQAFLLQGVPGC